MRTSSTRRLGAALSASTLAVIFALGSPAFAGDKGQGDEHRKDRTESTTVRPDSATDDDDSIADSAPADADADNAHPSGNDRHEDKGAQGHSNSTPDQNGSGPERDYQGTDKSYEVTADGLGGVDKEDQDGNNGCGNDDDFEDDNEGLCLGREKSSTPPADVSGTKTETCPEGTTMVAGGTAPEDCKKDEVVTQGSNPVVVTTVTPDVLGTGAVSGTDLQAAPAALESASVLGIQLERTAPAAVAAAGGAAPAGTSVLGATLARTGLSFTVLALAIALGLLAVGFGLKRAGRTQSDF